jgi:phosphoribosylaminoimidazolecarboxamide formyltransferase / IMP cyclohydrolase
LIYSIDGGFLRQSINNAADDYTQWQTVTKKTCSAAQVQDLKFAWHVIKHIKSNAILFAGDKATLGIGCGQTSRIFSLEIAALKAKHAGLDLNGSVMASDAFFPFADAIDMAAKLKISAIIQPGGSKRDNEVIDCANKHNIAMIFTGRRNFKH